MFVSENSQQLVGKIDPINTKQVVSHLGNEIWTQVVLQLGRHFRKHSLSSPRRGNESLAFVGKLDSVNLENGIRAQIMLQLGKRLRKQSLSSPRRGNETLVFVGKLDSVNLENGIRAQIMLQLGKRLRKQSLSSPRRGNESLAQGIALGNKAQANNVLKGQKHYRYVTITL